ncbi:MAG: hypothetical protein ACK5H0_10400 [Bacteroidota bacterium]|jgi:hypothetical protein
MTLDQLLADIPTIDDLRQLWIILDTELKDRLEAVQPFYQNQVSPIRLNNGDYALCADLVTEKDGLYAPTFAVLDQSTFPEIPVVSYDTIADLFPIYSVEGE